MQKLLSAPAGDTFTICTFKSYLHLWHKITFSDLLHYDLICEPFKLNGFWAAALRGSTPERSVWWG